MTSSRMAVEIFCAYTPADEKWRRQIDAHLSALERQGLISLWYDHYILPGANWAEITDTHLETASVILLFISADFIKSDYCYTIQMERALARHKNNEARVIPIIVRPCDWQRLPIGQLLALPTNMKPISTWNPVDEGCKQVAIGLRRVIEDLSQLEVSAPRTSLPSILMIPYPRNPFFTGREQILEQIHTRFQTEHAAALSQPQAINGLGGIGKTQIAIEYAHRYRQDYQAIFWTSADTYETLVSGYIDIAQLLHLPEADEQEQSRITQAVNRWLSISQDYLLILDNADDPDLLIPFIPSAYSGHLLITTRASALRRLNIADPITVETLSPEQGALFLLHRSGLLPHDVPLSQATPDDGVIAQKICSELGGLPLAIEQAAAYIETTSIDLVSYLTLYRQRHADLLRREEDKPPRYPFTVATVWNISFERVQIANPAAADLLRLCAFLSPDAIPEEILIKGVQKLGNVLASVVADPFLLNDAIAALRAYSLLTRDPRTRTLTVHRLVQTVLKDSLNLEAHERWRKRATRMVDASLPTMSSSHWKQWEQWLPHAQVCVITEDDDHQWIRETARIAHWVGAYLLERYYLREAEPYLQQALSWRVAHPLSGDSSTIDAIASTLDRLALLRTRQGRYAEAAPMYEQALNLSILVLGPNHHNTVTSFLSLGNLYQEQGRYADAEPLFKQALTLSEKHLGVNDPNFATSLDRLACAYLGQGKYAEAESLFKQALALSEKHLGTSHPDTTSTLSSLAILYLKLGRYIEAKPLLQRALTNNEEQLGTDHPHTAESLNSLAGFYQQQGQYTEAEPLFQRALAIAEQRLGYEHPTTGMYLTHLGNCYWGQRKYTEAEPLFQKALAIDEQQLGYEHPTTQMVRERYAALLRVIHQDEEIKSIEEQL